MSRRWTMIFAQMMMLTLIAAVPGCAGKPLEEPAYDDRAITIGGWVSPPPAGVYDSNPNFITDETYKDIADSGINLIYGLYEGNDANGKKALDAAQANGIRYLMYDRLMGGVQEEDFDLLETAFDAYKNHPAFAGNLVMDEPGGAKFDRIAKLHEIYKRVVPGKLFYINLFPTYSSVAQRDGLSYKEYINSYIEKVRPEFISFDYYPLMSHAVEGNYIKEDYLYNLEIVSEAAKGAGIPFWSFIQAMSFTAAGMTNREVDEADIRWQVYTNLAYGSQGIQYFCYWSPLADGAANFGHAMIAQDGSKTPVYEAVRVVNQEIRDFDHIFMAMKHKGVMLFPKDGLTNEMFTEKSLASFAPVRQIDTENPLVVGCFEDGAGYSALVLVNYTDPSDGVSTPVRVTFEDAKEIVVYAKGVKTRVTLKKGVYETVLGPGEGQFVLVLK
jgi:hypothetical protein